MSAHNYKDSVLFGKQSEELFLQFISQETKLEFIREANKKEQLYEHWDFLYRSLSNKELKFEVKGKKSISRGSPRQSDFILLELHGGDVESNLGWLYGSCADFIAFAIDDTFWLFYREKLIEFVNRKFNITKIEEINLLEKFLSYSYKKSPHYNNMQPYKIYYRNVDLFTWIPKKDLLKIRFK